jgi:hypothetical protein
MGNVFDVVDVDGTEYRFHLMKRANKTRIYGLGYEEFISKYGTTAGVRIRILLITLPNLLVLLQKVPHVSKRKGCKVLAFSFIISIF